VYLGKSFIVWLFVGFKITFYPLSRKRTSRIRHSIRWLRLWHFLMTHFVFVKLFKPQRPIFLWSVLKKLVLSLANKIVGKSRKTKLQKDSFSLSFFLLCQADMTQSSHRFQIAAFVRLKNVSIFGCQGCIQMELQMKHLHFSQTKSNCLQTIVHYCNSEWIKTIHS
jgi:hypothetical protein